MAFIKREAKEFKAILACIGYRKRACYIVPSETITLQGLNWSGGSRNSYTAATLDGRPLGNAHHHHSPAPWFNAAEGARLPIPPGACVIQHGTFCGRDSVAYIYVNPADMPRVLPGVPV
jgi:hypothetical protein